MKRITFLAVSLFCVVLSSSLCAMADEEMPLVSGLSSGNKAVLSTCMQRTAFGLSLLGTFGCWFAFYELCLLAKKPCFCTRVVTLSSAGLALALCVAAAVVCRMNGGQWRYDYRDYMPYLLLAYAITEFTGSTTVATIFEPADCIDQK